MTRSVALAVLVGASRPQWAALLTGVGSGWLVGGPGWTAAVVERIGEHPNRDARPAPDHSPGPPGGTGVRPAPGAAGPRRARASHQPIGADDRARAVAAALSRQARRPVLAVWLDGAVGGYAVLDRGRPRDAHVWGFVVGAGAEAAAPVQGDARTLATAVGLEPAHGEPLLAPLLVAGGDPRGRLSVLLSAVGVPAALLDGDPRVVAGSGGWLLRVEQTSVWTAARAAAVADEPAWLRPYRTRPPWFRIANGLLALLLGGFAVGSWWAWAHGGSGLYLAVLSSAGALLATANLRPPRAPDHPVDRPVDRADGPGHRGGPP